MIHPFIESTKLTVRPGKRTSKNSNATNKSSSKQSPQRKDKYGRPPHDITDALEDDQLKPPSGGGSIPMLDIKGGSKMQEHLIGEFKVIHILSGAIPAPRARVGAESLTLEVLHTDNSDDKASSGYCSDDTILGDKCRNVAYEDGQNEVPK